MKLIGLLFASILLLSISAAGSHAAPEKTQVIIGLKDKPDTALIKDYGGEIKREFTLINAVAVKLPKNKIDILKKHPKIEYIEPDYEASALGENVPWGVARINAPQVWKLPNRGTGIRVAVLDTGIQYDHPDLKNNIKGGVNFAGYPDGSTTRFYWTDKNGHGTHAAGIVAAEDNDIGVVGVAPQAWLYSVRVLNDKGSGYYSDIIQGIEWSINNNMQVVSMSLGGSSSSYALKNAVDKARSRGIILVAAAGNSGDGNPATNNIAYPARYSSVIAVGATGSGDAVPRWSSDGREIDVAAPGVSIVSTYRGSTYATMSGTSMATPHVAGTVALMLKAGISPGSIQNKLQTTGVDLLPAGFDVFSGYGRINALRAVQ